MFSFDEVPSRVQQMLCGEVANVELFEQNLALHKPARNPAAASASTSAQEYSQPPKKKVKSQRRMEKEKEYFERQQRMEANNLKKNLAKKKSPCRFFAMGKCQQGDKCSFAH